MTKLNEFLKINSWGLDDVLDNYEIYDTGDLEAIYDGRNEEAKETWLKTQTAREAVNRWLAEKIKALQAENVEPTGVSLTLYQTRLNLLKELQKEAAPSYESHESTVDEIKRYRSEYAEQGNEEATHLKASAATKITAKTAASTKDGPPANTTPKGAANNES